MRQRVLAREEPIVRLESDVGTRVHRFGQDVRGKTTGQDRRNRVLEEDPDVCASTGAGSFECRRNIQAKARFQEYSGIIGPPVLIKVDREDEARFIEQHRINASDERLSSIVVAGQVPSNDRLIDGKKSPARAFRALDTRLLADPADPFVRAGRRVSGFAGFATLKSPGIDVFATAEQRTEQARSSPRQRRVDRREGASSPSESGVQREETILSLYDRGRRVPLHDATLPVTVANSLGDEVGNRALLPSKSCRFRPNSASCRREFCELVATGWQRPPASVEKWKRLRKKSCPSTRVKIGGEAGIRTLGTGLSPYNGLANRRFRPLSHLTGRENPQRGYRTPR